MTMLQRNNFLLFLIIWIGDFFSTIGSGLTAFCLGVYAFNLTGEATSTSLIVLCSFLPAFFLRPIGGLLADRFDRAVLMIIGNLGSGLGIGLTLFMMYKETSLVFVYPGILLSSAFFAIQNPAYKASISDFLPAELYSKASGLVQLSSAAQFLIAPLVGGILMSLMSIYLVLIIDLSTFIFSASMVFLVKSKLKTKQNVIKSENSSLWMEFLEGIKVISKNKGILVLVSLISLLLFYIGLIQALLTPMVLVFANARTLGIAQSLCAVGMLFSSIIIGMVKRKRNNVFILTWSLSLMGLCFSIIGIRENIWLVIIPGCLFFSTIPYANSSIDVLIRTNISNEKQGRIWALISVFTYLGSLVAYATAGFLADKIFNPLLMPGARLANTFVGSIFGVGPGRGIAFIFFLSGIFVILLSIAIYRSKSIRELEQNLVDNEIVNLSKIASA